MSSAPPESPAPPPASADAGSPAGGAAIPAALANPPAPAVTAPPPPPPAVALDPGPPKLDPLAAVLSYLIPGLGQVYQGRTGKGLLFFGGLYALFFYGMAMGQWKNVWLPAVADQADVEVLGWRLGGPAKAVAYRPQFMGQFWIGAAAWPAVVQYAKFDPNAQTGPIFGTFQRAPTEEELNDLQRNGNKRWDLGWVYTVIAGVLNLLVIYDALAGPMFRDPPGKDKDEEGKG
ncbi:hypothetical protein J0H58_20140 [bacterium]|nr:hypothetical protein [bacterium]